MTRSRESGVRGGGEGTESPRGSGRGEVGGIGRVNKSKLMWVVGAAMILVTGLTSSTVSIKQTSPCQRLLNDLVRESPGPTETTPVHLVLVSSIVMSVLVVVRDGA